MKKQNTITSRLLAESERTAHVASLYGWRFAAYVEPFIFDNASSLSEDYDGGYWHFHSLSNGGFYMAPDLPAGVLVRSANGFEGRVSSDTFGLCACLYAMSQLSFSTSAELSGACAQQYHWLRDFAKEHEEAINIFAIID